MKNKGWRAKLISILLVVTLAMSGVTGVQAQETSDGAAQVESRNTESTQGDSSDFADVKKEENGESTTEGTQSDETEKDTTPGSAEEAKAGMQKESDQEKTESNEAGTKAARSQKAQAQTAEMETPAAAAQTDYGMTVTLQIEAYGETIKQGVQVTMPDTYKTFAEYGLTGVTEPEEPGYTVLHVMAEYCEETYGAGTAASLINIGVGGFISGFLKLPRKSTLMFLRNHGSLQVGAQKEKVQAGDLISVVDIWANNSWTIGGQYGWFEQEQMTAEAGNPFSVKLNVTPLMWNEAANPAGATVKVLDSQGNVAAEGKTDSNGGISLMVEKEGTYTVTAERKSGYYDTDDSNPWDLVPPHGTLTVTTAAELTDEEAVKKAEELLGNQLSELVDVNQITGDFTLPDTGSYHTQIAWTSSDENFIKIEGTQAKVTRPVGADKSVTLTAVITRNTGNARAEARAEKEIAVTVIGKALFTELSVDHGTLEYEKSIDAYTVYVKDDVEKLTISGTAAEGVNLVWCTVTKQDGTSNRELKITSVDSEFSSESWLMAEDSDFTPQEIKLETVGTTTGTVTITVKRGNPGEPLPDLPDIAWGQHLGDKNNNAVVDVKTPEGEGGLLWESFSNAPDSWGSVYAGTPILVNGSIYAVRNHKLEMLDARTGKVQASAELASKVGYYSNIIYGGGMIFVPLGDGSVQSFHAATLESLYLLASPAPFGKSYSVYGAMHYDEGRLYIGYSDGSYVNPVGCYAAYDTMDLDINSETEEITELWVTEGRDGQSYYGSGAVTVEDKVIVAGDSGIAYVHNSETGDKISEVKLDGKVRGALVYAESYIWAVTQNAKIYKLSLSETGSLSIVAEGQLPLSTSASPVVVSGKVYITGGSFDKGGFFAVYDLELNLLAEERTENSLNTPTVTTAYDDTYAYFTENGEAGSLYMAKITGNNKVTVTKIYTPEHPQYSMSKVVVGVDGTLYYGNDAGYLYAICAKAGEKPDDGKDDGSDQEQGGNKGTDSNANKNITSVTQLKNLAPQTRTVRVNASKGKTESVKDKLIEAVENSGKKEKNSLTVDNPPEIIEAEVFAALAEYPGLRLILNCGNYTLSIKGSEITDTSASLSTKLIEFEDTLSEKEAEKYGNHQQLALVQEGSLPGKITVVYHLGEQLEGSETLYLYDLAQEEVQKVTVEKPYAMFVMTHAGSYILSDMQADEGVVSETAGGIPDSLKTKDTGTKKASSLPVWVYLLIGLSSGVLLSGVITASILRARKRRETWEE